jgi:hypothetical protein
MVPAFGILATPWLALASLRTQQFLLTQ